MKNSITLYWVAKGFISFFMLYSAYFSYSHAKDLEMLGFPDYFRIELVIAKVIGGLVLLFPQIPLRIKEWVYAGFCITMVSALIAHICSHDAVYKIVFVSIDLLLIVTAIRYVSRRDLAARATRQSSDSH
jgi:putative oxidoreductase